MNDQRISKDGVIVLKAQQHRTLEKNKSDALERLKELILDAIRPVKRRRPTRPTKGSQVRRVDKKTKKGKTKALRGKVDM
ncbi:MAG: aminoacyl-tRNA hydrolase, partial [Natronospirillum sp.]